MDESMESPSRGSQTPKTPNRTPGRYQPNASIISGIPVNDDEAERESRRSTLSGYSENEMTLTEENAAVSSLLQMFSENKFNRDNVWNFHLIDHFSNLVAKHHKSMSNFQTAGSALEASAKIYVLKVDSLHQQALRIASTLTRESARALGAARNADEDDDEAENGMDRSLNNNLDQNSSGKRTKEKRKRRTASVITKNPESLNAKLETNPFTDPFFAKLNSIVGDVNSSSRLMQNIIGTKKGSLQLRTDLPFWDKREMEPPVYDENENYENQQIVRIKTHEATTFHAIHHELKGYSISDKPAEDEQEEEMPQSILHHSIEASFHDRSVINASIGAGIVFDPDAEVEPIPVDNNFMIDLGPPDGENAFSQLEEEDHEAIMRCRGLRRAPVIVEDMAPVDSTSGTLEYSYRPLENFTDFWAGPSHWKIRRQPSMARKSFTQASQAGSQVVASKRKRRKKKEVQLFTKEDLFNFDPGNVFVKRDPANPIKKITHTSTFIRTKWNSKKLKLPTHMQFEDNMFDNFLSGPQFRPMNIKEEVEPELEVEKYDYNNEVDIEYCRDVHAGTEPEIDFAAGDNPNISDEQNIMSPPPFASPINDISPPTPDFIGTQFADAPEQVEKIEIHYAKRAKPVDMKQLKSKCWNLISELPGKTSAETANGETVKEIEFKDVYDNLPKVLTKSMAENMSTGLAFYSLLHLANEKGIEIVQHEDLDGCTIVKKDNSP
ncbi:condensin complex subunit 2-like [Culicoides brevitarsis]|uniref:condensin complex subunit 2-like n=1 Tax=Culicoides brevitarsis TaxID=469753 RepID=UPI00307CB136